LKLNTKKKTKARRKKIEIVPTDVIARSVSDEAISRLLHFVRNDNVIIVGTGFPIENQDAGVKRFG